MSLANCTPFWIAASDSSEPSVGSRICLNIVTSFVVPFDRAGSFVASKKKPAHPSDKSPEWLALNSPFHFPLRRTSYVLPVWPQIMAEAFSMMGEAHERTIITRKRTVKNLHLASGFSAIRTRSEQRLKTINGELARAISKFNAHLSIFLWKNVSTEVGCDLAQHSRAASRSSRISLEGTSGFVSFSEPATWGSAFQAVMSAFTPPLVDRFTPDYELFRKTRPSLYCRT